MGKQATFNDRFLICINQRAYRYLILGVRIRHNTTVPVPYCSPVTSGTMSLDLLKISYFVAGHGEEQLLPG
jgi:hypothetical protein